MDGGPEVVVVGAGQAGLAVSHELTRANVEHIVLERRRLAERWRARWDSFCLVTPNWSVLLPGQPYDGDTPDGFMARDEIVGYLERYAHGFRAPVQEGVEVTSLRALGRGFALETSAGPLQAHTVVLCTGAYQRPYRPPAADTLPADLFQIDLEDYRNPAQLPAGAVLVIGSGQSGCQLAEELHESGREVYLACGRASWAPRLIGERDLVWWLREVGDLDDPVASLPDPAARLRANLQATGHGGGRDLHYRTLQAMGVTLLGRFLAAEGRHARFATDLSDSVAWGDERNAQFMDRIRKRVAERGLPPVDIPDREPFRCEVPELLRLSGMGAVIFTGGFRPDYESWVHCPGAFDELGFPVQQDGASSVVPRLYFVGVHFLRKRKSSLLVGVGEDAALVADQIATERGSASD